MRSSWVLVVVAGVTACTHAEVAPVAAVHRAPEPLPPVEAPPGSISLVQLGAGEAAEWTALAMPDDARVLSFAQNWGAGRETWTLAEAGSRRVLRMRWENGNRVSSAAWVGTAAKDRMELRLVELHGHVHLAAEHLKALCRRDAVCEQGKPQHRVAVEMCTFEDESTGAAVTTFLAPGNGIDFTVGSCPHVQREPRSERKMTRRF